MTRPNGPARQQSGPYEIPGHAHYFARSRSEIEVGRKTCPGSCRVKTIRDLDAVWAKGTPTSASKSSI
jgi:hypothetical protein